MPRQRWQGAAFLIIRGVQPGHHEVRPADVLAREAEPRRRGGTWLELRVVALIELRRIMAIDMGPPAVAHYQECDALGRCLRRWRAGWEGGWWWLRDVGKR